MQPQWTALSVFLFTKNAKSWKWKGVRYSKLSPESIKGNLTFRKLSRDSNTHVNLKLYENVKSTHNIFFLFPAFPNQNALTGYDELIMYVHNKKT
jgi:hypothetical protein